MAVVSAVSAVADRKERLVNRPIVTSGPPVIQWRDYYSVGNLELDGQHQEIIYMINWLYEVIWEGDDPAALRTLMRRLSEYTRSHFEHEEGKMREAGFPDYLEHKRIHDKLADDTSDLLFGSLQEDGPNPRDVLAFLKQWWINHITGDDKEYMFYLTESRRTGLLFSCADRELRELMTALIENEQRLRHYYEVMSDFVPEHRRSWEALQRQEEAHVKVLQTVCGVIEGAPAQFAVGKISPNAARVMTSEVNGMVGKIERHEVHPKYAIRFAVDLEQSLLESHLDQAIKTDVIEVRNMLSRLSQDTASHRGLLRSMAD